MVVRCAQDRRRQNNSKAYSTDWKKRLRDDFKAFGALHGSTPTDRRTFGVDRLVGTDGARKEEGVPWYTGVLLGAEIFMASRHKSQEEASRLREVINRAAKQRCW